MSFCGKQQGISYQPVSGKGNWNSCAIKHNVGPSSLFCLNMKMGLHRVSRIANFPQWLPYLNMVTWTNQKTSFLQMSQPNVNVLVAASDYHVVAGNLLKCALWWRKIVNGVNHSSHYSITGTVNRLCEYAVGRKAAWKHSSSRKSCPVNLQYVNCIALRSVFKMMVNNEIISTVTDVVNSSLKREIEIQGVSTGKTAKIHP